jgi:hypothetical protein
MHEFKSGVLLNIPVADPFCGQAEARRAIERLTAQYHPHSRTPRQHFPAVNRQTVRLNKRNNRAHDVRQRGDQMREPAAGVRELLERDLNA